MTEQRPNAGFPERRSIEAAAFPASLGAVDADSGSFSPMQSPPRDAAAPRDHRATESPGNVVPCIPLDSAASDVSKTSPASCSPNRSTATDTGAFCQCSASALKAYYAARGFGATMQDGHGGSRIGDSACFDALLQEEDEDVEELPPPPFFATLKAAFAASPNVWRLFLFTAVYNIGASIVWSTSVWPPFLKESFGENTTLGWVASASGFMELAAAILSGFAADHIGRNFTIRVASCLLLLACVGMGVGVFLESFPAIMVGSGGAGLAYGAFFPCTEALFADSVAPCQRTVVYTCKYALEVGAGLIGVCLSLSLFLAIGNTWDIATLKIVIGTGLGVVVAAALSLFLLDSRYALPESVLVGDEDPLEDPNVDGLHNTAGDSASLSRVESAALSHGTFRRQQTHQTLGYASFAGAFTTSQRSFRPRPRRYLLEQTFASDPRSSGSSPRRHLPHLLHTPCVDSQDWTMTSEHPAHTRPPPSSILVSDHSLAPAAATDGSVIGAEGRSDDSGSPVAYGQQVSSDGEESHCGSPDLRRRLPENSGPRYSDESATYNGGSIAITSPISEDRRNCSSVSAVVSIPDAAASRGTIGGSRFLPTFSPRVCPLCKKPQHTSPGRGVASSFVGSRNGNSARFSPRESPSASATDPHATLGKSKRAGQSRVALSPPPSFRMMHAGAGGSSTSFLPVVGKTNQRSIDRVVSLRTEGSRLIHSPTLEEMGGTRGQRLASLPESIADASHNDPPSDDLAPLPESSERQAAYRRISSTGAPGLVTLLDNPQRRSTKVPASTDDTEVLTTAQAVTTRPGSSHKDSSTEQHVKKRRAVSITVAEDESSSFQPSRTASRREISDSDATRRFSQGSSIRGPSASISLSQSHATARRRSSSVYSNVGLEGSRQVSMTSAPASRASIGPGRTSFMFGSFASSKVASFRNPDHQRTRRRSSRITMLEGDAALSNERGREHELHQPRVSPKGQNGHSTESHLPMPEFSSMGESSSPRGGHNDEHDNREDEDEEEEDEEVKIDYNCEGCGLFRVPPWLAPYCLSFSNVFVSAGGGMTVLYFSLFMRDTFGASPVVLQLLNGSVTIMTVFLAEMLALADARGVNRFFLQVPPTIIGVTGSLMLATIDGGAIATLWGTFVLFTFRMSMMSCNVGLIRALVMDLVNPAQRARWNALESLASAMWAASAAGGGYIIDSAGYRKSFLITFCIHTIAVGLLVAIMRNKDPKDEQDDQDDSPAPEDRSRDDDASNPTSPHRVEPATENDPHTLTTPGDPSPVTTGLGSP